jgi:hypothetical protein
MPADRAAPTEPRPLNDPSTKRAILIVALRGALVAALAFAGWAVYRKLPQDESGAARAGRASKETLLRIVLSREGLGDAGVADTSVELYSVDVAAARREFDDERRYGQRFEDFVTRRMGARQPVSAKLNGDGQAVVVVAPGRWWVHAKLAGANELTWRLPVNVSGREQTVELTPSNAYTRTKSF